MKYRKSGQHFRFNKEYMSYFQIYLQEVALFLRFDLNKWIFKGWFPTRIPIKLPQPSPKIENHAENSFQLYMIMRS